MFELDEIPDWMVQYIPEITDGSHTTIEGIKEDVRKLKPLHMEGGMVVMLNSRIALLNNLKKADNLK